MEQVLDWLNENELRSFPLMEGSSPRFQVGDSIHSLPDNFLLDLQIKTNLSLQQNSVVYLKSLRYSPETGISVKFGTVAADIVVFTLSSSSRNDYPKYVRTEAGHLAVFGEGVVDLLDIFEPSGIVQEHMLTIPVEPSVCIQFNDAWLGVNSIKGAPEKQTEQDSFSPTLPLVAASSTALVGDVIFLEGYNFRIAVQEGMIDLEISANFGLRMNCTTSFISEEYLDCDKLLSYINGIPPDSTGTFRLNAGANMNIIQGNSIDLSDDPVINTARQHALFVGLNFQSSDLCAPVNLAPESA